MDFFSVSIYIMPRKYGPKKLGRKPRKVAKKSYGRRRLQPSLRGGDIYDATPKYSPNRKVLRKARANARYKHHMRIEQSDNITTLPTFKHGVAKKPTFSEKVIRLTNPPVIFKRNYQWSAECNSGRKGFFGIEINDLLQNKPGGGGLFDDIMTSAVRRLTTDTATQDPTYVANGVGSTQQKFYIDYQSLALNMINSGSNSLVGKIRLFSYKRDCESAFTNTSAPMNPLNLAMYASQNGGNVTIDGQQEGVLGNFGFNSATPGVDFDANYTMPGSAQNSGGATVNADLAFDVMGSQIKSFVGYFFKEVATMPFSLKPGQQVKHTSIFNDLPILHRAALDVTYIKGISFYMLIEFNAGIVGDSTAANVISTGSGQLSCMLVEKRILGAVNRTHVKLVMPTTAPAGILVANQQIINSDTGVVDTGYEDDA